MIQAGQKFGEFEIFEQIGRGGMGAVFKARQTSLRRFVAIKVLQPALAANAQYIIRFNNEAVAAAGLNHPNLVQVHAAGETDGVHWFAMEFVEGETVRARLKRKGRIEPAEAIAIATHVATALEYGWRKAQLIHRDIKPDNIFLSQDGEVKLGDLGLAKSTAQEDGLTITGASMGTPRYISPEQAQGKKDIDLRADIYSLGCTLFHLLSGQQPYSAENAVEMMCKHVTEPVPELRSVWPECPAELSRVVMKMMAKPPAARQQTHVAVIADLRRAHDALTGASMPDVIALSQPPSARSLKKVAVFSLPDPQAQPAARTPVRTAAVARQPVASPSVPKVIATPHTEPAPDSENRKPKSKALLWSGIAAILAVALWFAFGKKEPQLTEAERAEEAIAQKRARSIPAPELWVCVLDKLGDHPPDGTTMLQDGWVMKRPASTTRTRYLPGAMRDGAIRAELRRTGDENGRLALRSRVKEAAYQVARTDTSVRLEFIERSTAKTTVLREHATPMLTDGATFTLELRVVGALLTVKLDGRELFQVEDNRIVTGSAAVLVGDKSSLRNIEVLNLDAPAAASALPISAPSLTAAKDVPFVNSLGMKFVPVPITGGPTGGQRVLFSIWETRVQDYETFATQTEREWNNVQSERSATHPAAFVSQHDAGAFCTWLTALERSAGKLGAGEAYRLPTDHEWSCAVGIGDREDPALSPYFKNRKIADVFPWGRAWPPPAGVGNYGGEERNYPTPMPPGEEGLSGYRDDFRDAALVGSFAVNPIGLYDLGGNL
ncbi:MAG: protein kinase [Chthoniobacteraceae bacterium]